EVIDLVLQGWDKGGKKPEPYTPGTWGPQSAIDLIEKDGRRWLQGSDGEPIIACSL
ncbi:MAG: Glucose-6-phosphate 1-dehydrogenase, partial [Phycisphaerales bacterium]|nr:Glucose-6-phosphate 1-dehydrogenase [Phycisphaerales bacterium]